MLPISQQITKQHVLAYYGRVSQPRQKIEHQRETVDRWLQNNELSIPANLRFEDRGGRRHRADKRDAFQQLMELVRKQKVDWIVIASFSRWGVADVNEFYKFRNELSENFVRLYCINSDLELTGCSDGDYYRVTSEALATTACMKTHAEQNIMKMVLMAEKGQHMSGAVPYGLDLECRNLDDSTPLYRVHLIRKLRFKNRLIEVTYADGRSESTTDMPLRDGKKTGYWLIVGKDQKRLEAVRAIFRLYDQGLTNSEIRNWLWSNELHYFGDVWQDNAIYAVLDNPAYIGMPAWGKIAKGHYQQVSGKQPRQPKRLGKGEPKQFVKSCEDWVFPNVPVFDQEAIISLEVWERVKAKRDAARGNRKNRPRQRNRSQHILNGIIRCGECGERMVIGKRRCRDGSSESGYWCGTYAKTKKIKCRHYWTRMPEVDKYLDQFLEELSGTFGKIKTLLDAINNVLPGLTVTEFEADTQAFIRDELKLDPRLSMQEALDTAQVKFEQTQNSEAQERNRQSDEIQEKIDHLTSLLMNPKISKSVQEKLIAESSELDAKLVAIQTREPSPFERLATLHSQADALLNEGKNLKSRMVELFVDRVVTKHELRQQRNGTISKLVGFEYHFVETLSEPLGASKELCTRKGKDSMPLQA